MFLLYNINSLCLIFDKIYTTLELSHNSDLVKKGAEASVLKELCPFVNSKIRWLHDITTYST